MSSKHIIRNTNNAVPFVLGDWHFQCANPPASTVAIYPGFGWRALSAGAITLILRGPQIFQSEYGMVFDGGQ